MNNERLMQLQKLVPPKPDILGREQYNSSAILVPLVHLHGEEQLLFERRAPHIKQGSEICFPGGHFDITKDDSYLETAIRETIEELGVEREKISIIGQLDTLVSPRGLIVECYLAGLDLSSLEDLHLDSMEVDEVFCVPVRWFINNPPEIYHTRVEIQSSYRDDSGNREILLPVDELGLPPHYKKNRSEWMHRVAVYRHERTIIWGLTAAVVDNLIRKVFSGRQGGGDTG